MMHGADGVIRRFESHRTTEDDNPIGPQLHIIIPRAYCPVHQRHQVTLHAIPGRV